MIRKHTLLFTFIISVLIVAAVLSFLKTKIGDVRPAVLLPSDEISKTLKTQKLGKRVDFPLELPPEFSIGVFADGIPGARDLEFSLGGTLLASRTKAGIVVALPDKDQDGIADKVVRVLEDLDKPHGLAFYPSLQKARSGQVYFFVAEETRVVRYLWDEKNLSAEFDKKLFDLPRGDRHFTRTIAIDQAGTMYVSIGSSCDTCFEKHPFLAAVIKSDIDGAEPKLFAKGLRNAVFITLHPGTEKLWGTEMGRDFLGDDLPPDEVNIIAGSSTLKLSESKSSGQNPIPDFGWPVCYGNGVYDVKFGQKSSRYCGDTVKPVHNLQAHVSPLGLTFIDSPHFPESWQGDLLVAFHGSWNRSVPVGYKVVKLKVDNNKVIGEEDFITGFLPAGSSNAIGRPVDVEFSPDGNLYISDDKTGVIYLVWRLSKQ